MAQPLSSRRPWRTSQQFLIAGLGLFDIVRLPGDVSSFRFILMTLKPGCAGASFRRGDTRTPPEPPGGGPQKAEPNKRLECCETIRAWRMPLPKIGSMDGNTGRSEGATAEKAVPFPCAVLDPNRSSVELRVGEPDPGARSARI
jgi:hypothetical protein